MSKFIDGLFFNLPHESAPDFVKGKISLKVSDVINFLTGWQDQWVNIDLKVSKDGKPYAIINEYKKPEEPVTEPVDETVFPGEEDMTFGEHRMIDDF